MSVKDTTMIVQLIDADNGTRTKPFSGTPDFLAKQFKDLLEIEIFPEDEDAMKRAEKLEKAFVLVLADDYKKKNDLDYSHYPLQTVKNFIKTNGVDLDE